MHVLLVKTSSLGDVVHNLPVVTDLQRHVPGVTIDWVVEHAFADIPRLHPGVRRVIPLALRRWRKAALSTSTWKAVAEFRRDLHADAYDVVLDTQGLIKSALVARQARLASDAQRSGYAADSAREPLAARFYASGFSIAKNLHAIRRNRQLAAAAFGYTLDAPLDYGIDAEPLKVDWLPSSPYMVFLTGTSRADKLWATPNWNALARALAMPIVLPAGNDGERSRAQQLAQQMPQAVVAPSLRIADLAGVLSGARIVIGLDTGLTHLAAALGKPAIAIFAGSDPRLTGVLGSNAGQAVNLGGIGAPPDAAQVIDAARRLL